MSKDVFYVGVDVGSREVCGSVAGLKARCFAHSGKGIVSLRAWADKTAAGREQHFCLEGTGVYGVSVATLLLREPDTRVSIVNPAQIKAFAKAQLRRCKTDQVDAEVIRQFAEATQPPLWQPPSKEQRQLSELVLLRDQLLAELQQWRNRRHSREYLNDLPTIVKQTYQGLLRSLRRQLQKVESAITAFVAENAQIAQQVQLLSSIPGIADRSAVQLLAYGQNWLTDVSAKALVAHCGLAPHPKQSGSSLNRGGALDKRGNWRIRKALYMPTITAIRHNPIIKNFYVRLCARGKAKMVAIIAAMKKLLLIARAILKHKKTFNCNLKLLT